MRSWPRLITLANPGPYVYSGLRERPPSRASSRAATKVLDTAAPARPPPQAAGRPDLPAGLPSSSNTLRMWADACATVQNGGAGLWQIVSVA